MSFFARALRAIPRASTSTPSTMTFLRASSMPFSTTATAFNEADPETPFTSSSSSAGPRRLISRRAGRHFKVDEATHLMPEDLHANDPDRWWRQKELGHSLNLGGHMGIPGNQYSGRTLHVRAFTETYRRLQATLKRANVAKELRQGEYWERPTNKRRRLRSERHRRRFAEEIRQRVQTVQILQSRK